MKRIDIRSFLEHHYVSMPGFSHDGRYIAFVVQKPDLKKNGYQGDLYLLEKKSGMLIRLTNTGDAKGYTWTPDGTLLFSALRDDALRAKKEAGFALTAFYEISVSDRDAKAAFVLPLNDARLICVDGDRYIVKAEYDRNFPNLAGLDDEKAHEAAENYAKRSYDVLEELPYWFNGKGVVSGKRTRLYLYTRSSGELKPITGPNVQVEEMEDAPVRGGRVVFTAKEYTDIRPETAGVYLYDVYTDTLSCLVEPDRRRIGVAALMGDSVLMASKGESDAPLNPLPDFYICDIKTHEVRKLLDFGAGIGYNSVGSDARLGGGRTWKVDGDALYFLTTIEERGALWKIDVAGNVAAVLDKQGCVDAFDIYGGDVTWCGFTGQRLAELFLGEKKVTGFNDGYSETYDVSVPAFHSYTGTDGYEIHGYAMKPIGWEQGRTYPAILHIHGGPRTAFGDIYHHEMQMWAAQGYYVLYCNPRGSDGRGHDFSDITGRYGMDEYDNLMEFTDEMLNKYPDIDPNRLGVAGGSYGGFMTNWIIGHTSRFMAAVSQRSISNFIAHQYASDTGYFFIKQELTVSTEEDVEKVWWHSPLKYVGNVTTPTLFIHSDEDYRCWLVEGISMFSGLKAHGVETRLCLFKGENHELSRSGKPQNRISRMKEILHWFDIHLNASAAGVQKSEALE